MARLATQGVKIQIYAFQLEGDEIQEKLAKLGVADQHRVHSHCGFAPPPLELYFLHSGHFLFYLVNRVKALFMRSIRRKDVESGFCNNKVYSCSPEHRCFVNC